MAPIVIDFNVGVAFGTANYTPLVPTHVEGDLLLAYHMVAIGEGFQTIPAGWATEIDVFAGGTGNGGSIRVYSRIATASEPASYTWSTFNARDGSFGMMSIRGADPSNPINAVVTAAEPTVFSNNHLVPSLSPTVDDTLIIDFLGSRPNFNNGNWAPPAGVLEIVDSDDTSQGVLGVGHFDKALAGPTGTRTWVSGLTSGHSIGVLAIAPAPLPVFESVASNSGSGLTALPIPKPAGLVVGELMVGIVSHHFFGQVTTVPAGWTKVGSDFVAAAGNPRSTLAFKIADAGDVAASDFTFTRTGVAAGIVFIGAILRISGIDPSAPINVSLFNSTTPFGTSIATPSVVTTVNGVLLVRAAVSFSELPSGPLPTATGPGTYIERLDIADIQVAAKEMGLHIYTIIVNQPSAGATGTELITISDLNGGMNVNPGVTGLTIAIAPVLPVPPGGGPIGGPRSPFRILARRWRVLGTGA